MLWPLFISKEHPMATVSKELADKIVLIDVTIKDDPRVYRMWNTPTHGSTAYGMEHEWEMGKYSHSEYNNNPKSIGSQTLR